MKFSLSLKTLSMASVLLFTACMPIFVYATDPTDFTTGLNDVKTLAGQSGLNDKQQTTKQILQTIVAWLMSLLGTIALISLLYGGYLYITAQGEEGNVEKAKSIILYSTIGIILIGLSAVIVNVVISVATQ